MPAALEAAAAPDLDDSLEDDLGPNFDAMDALPNDAAPQNAEGTALEQATRAIDKYICDIRKDIHVAFQFQ